MPETIEQISVTSRNTELPFFPNATYNLLEADKGKIDLPAFSWIQAFFDATFSGTPQLAIFTGYTFPDGSPLLSLVRFAYSGERINIKGSGIFASGQNVRNQAVISTVIGAVLTDDLSQVIAYGGMR